MAFQFKAPNVVSTVAKPYVAIPESARSHAGQAAVTSGLMAIRDVANVWRDHQDAVVEANSMASLLDANDMPQEADAYRRAAKLFRPNFFSDPKSASAARKSMLSDAINMLSVKYARDKDAKMMELKERELDVTREYKESQAISSLARAEAALKESENRAANAVTRAEQAAVASDLATRRAEVAEARLAFDKEKQEQEYKLRVGREARMQSQADLSAAKWASQQAAIKAAKDVIDEYGLTPSRADANGNVVYTSPKSPVTVKVTRNSDNTWTRTVTGLTPEQADEELPKPGDTPPPADLNRVTIPQPTFD